jgi:type I restriction enzyme R subunit
MSTVGQVERKTQRRVVKLFRDTLGYDYLGDWTDRAGNRNVEEDLLRTFLREKQRYDEALVTRALHILDKAAGDTSKSHYDRNRDVYDLLRYSVKVRPGMGENTEDVWLIDWEHPEENHFAIAEEVTVAAASDKAHPKRPDIVLYVNGIALGVLELKRSTVSVAEGIRQNLDNQKKEFIQPFFSTMQWVMAGNDTEGLRYGSCPGSLMNFFFAAKVKRVRNAIREALLSGGQPAPKKPAVGSASVVQEGSLTFTTDAEAQKLELVVDEALDLVKNQHEY